MTIALRAGGFYGWRVVGTAFVLAALGWGIGFYGPPIYLQAIRKNRGWPVALISTAVTTHFVIGAVVGPICRHCICVLAYRSRQRRVQSYWLLASSAGPARQHLGCSLSQRCSAAQAGLR
jgi:hypothetical protein